MPGKMKFSAVTALSACPVDSYKYMKFQETPRL